MSNDITPALGPKLTYESETKDEKSMGPVDDEIEIKAAQEGTYDDRDHLDGTEEVAVMDELGLNHEEIEDLENQLNTMTLDRTINIIRQVREIHRHDQNFPGAALERINQFLDDPRSLDDGKHTDLIREMKIEAILSTTNSPYTEVRANVDPTDDVTMPSLTFRVWVLGVLFAGAGSFIDTFFNVRNPPVIVGANIAQLLAYPLGKFMAGTLPTRQFNMLGRTVSLNPGKFSKKEHMLITIMANVSFGAPYTNYIVPVQALPIFFNQSYAYSFGYQILNTIGTNFVGYGLAGLTRRFLVYPAAAVWPTSLVTIALNKAFHTEINEPVAGPFGKTWRMSREKFFLIAFGAMFVYFFFPAFIFQALSYFDWMTWIAPNSIMLSAVTGSLGGLGLNPLPTFDWNVFNVWFTPLTVPTFSVMNQFVGMLVSFFVVLGVWCSNAWNSGYMPINSNHTFDNQGGRFNVSMILNDQGQFDNEKYQRYSQPWMSAGYVISFLFYFAMYTSTISYVGLYHRHDLKVGATNMWKAAKRTIKREKKVEVEDDLAEDIHYRLMKKYPEVPEWQYLIVLCVAAAIGMIGVGIYPTNTSPVVVIFGIIMPLIAMVPIGLVQAVTGIQVGLNVLAEFIGGSFVQGNAVGLMYFKTYGYISTYQALLFSNDLKLAHYLKLPPRHTFACQLVATLINAFISTALLNFQMSFKNVCTADAAFNFSCPGQNTFFTSAVFWGTLSPKRLFGSGRRYNLMLLGLPIGFVLPFIHYFLRKRYPRSEFLRQVHPVMLMAGPAIWGPPYNLSNFWPNVPVVWFSWQYLRKHYNGLWRKYNFVLAAAFPAGIAISAVVIFFALQIPRGGLAIEWWGNTVVGSGCEGGGCPRLEVPDVGYYGNAPGSGTFT